LFVVSVADGFREGPYIVEGRKPKIIGNIHPSGVGMNGNVYSSTALAPTLTTNKGEGLRLWVSIFFLNLFIKACFLGENIANARLE
jgi:hypothetical protein